MSRVATVRLLIATLLSGLLSVTAVPAAAQTTTEPDQNPCPNRHLPPPPVDSSEEPLPGQPSPTPLPVPPTPIGGERMGECGLVLPAGAPAPPADITAESWLLQDLDTGEVLATKDPHGRQRPASLIKTLLALVVIDELEPEEIVVPTRTDAEQECTCVGILPGEEYAVEQLLHTLLMHSGNDVAHALGTALGGVEVAVDKMNMLAAELGALDTRAATPSGLDGPGMMTSAYDMGLIFQHALEQPRYAQAVGTQQLMFPGGPGKPDFPIYNDNKLWESYPGFLGGKTGFTDDSRHTYAGAAQRDSKRLAVIMLRAEQQPIRVSEQAERLLDYGFELASADLEPVGMLTTAIAEPATETTFAEPDPEVTEATAKAEDDPFGITGWIVTLVVTVLVLGGLVVVHHRGASQQAE